MYVIGAEGEHWDRLKEKYKERVNILPIVPYDKYIQYICMSDLIFDSYPLGGGASLCDAMKAEVAVVSPNPVGGSLDFIQKSKGFCHTKEEFIEKILKAIEDKNFAQNILQDELKYFSEECSIENWVSNIVKIFNNAPKQHKLRQIEDKNAPYFMNEYILLLKEMYN